MGDENGELEKTPREPGVEDKSDKSRLPVLSSHIQASSRICF